VVSEKTDVVSVFPMWYRNFSATCLSDTTSEIISNRVAYFGTSGKTEQDMKSAMHYDALSKTQIADSFADLQEKVKGTTGLKIANKIFVKNGFTVKPTFNEVATKSFDSGAEAVNFAQSQKAAKIINDWVESKTNNKIKDLIKSSSLDSDTRMILVNAIYFKGAWVHEFDDEDTERSLFFLDEQKTVVTDFMFIKEKFRYGVFPELDATVLELPYKNTDITLLIILPNSKTGLSSLEAPGKLNQIDLNEISSKLDIFTVGFFLPKFKIEYEVNLNNILTELGMGRMFSDNAEFTELLETSDRIKVSQVVHKAFIEVNEKGTEAAGASGIEFYLESLRIRHSRIEFKVDHPFFFTLRSKTQNIFMGRFVQPN
jgi:serpin B